MERADWKISMAQVIEFETLPRFTPTVKWTPNHQRGKVIPFRSQRESDSESCRWPDRDEALYRASLEYAQPLILEEEPLLENSSNINGEELFGVLILGLFSEGSPIGSGDGDGIPLFNRLILLFLALFWTNGMSVIRARPTGRVVGGFNGANARTLLRPSDRKDVSASYESLIP
jgi:hypothetical protein